MQIEIEISSYDKERITHGYYIPKEINMEIARAIANGTPLSNSEKTNKWIPVSERLPDKEDWYLVTEVDGSFITVNMRLWTTEGWIVPQSIEDKLNILAWMPLPEPYEVVNEADV